MADKLTSITDDISFSGEIISGDHIEIAGKVEGKIKTSGRVEVKNGAEVKAEIQAHDMLISGQVQGNVTASAGIHLSDKAVVAGDLHCANLQIDKGARLNGGTIMGAS